jgi:hypothetical protein
MNPEKDQTINHPARHGRDERKLTSPGLLKRDPNLEGGVEDAHSIEGINTTPSHAQLKLELDFGSSSPRADGIRRGIYNENEKSWSEAVKLRGRGTISGRRRRLNRQVGYTALHRTGDALQDKTAQGRRPRSAVGELIVHQHLEGGQQ